MAVLETTFIIDLMKESKRGRGGPASAKLQELTGRGESLQLAIFTLAELYVGVAKSNQPQTERQAIQKCVSPFIVLPFEHATAEIFGSVVGELEKRGQSISDIDALIASVALEHAEILVTRNRKHYDRIPTLRVEDY
jgi:tRNA(fMet)-specific endonuclease VapC